MLHEGRFIADAPPEQLDDIDDEVVTRFVEGRASPEELATLRQERSIGTDDPADT
jgi:ABC-type transporter Mla maintaining outer membrane lipid asymmetry ATPase subunit MlaF